MTTIINFNTSEEQPTIPPILAIIPGYQPLVDAAASIGQKILNNPIVASCNRNSVIKATLIGGTGLAVTSIYLGTRALFPDAVTLPYTFTGVLILGVCALCTQSSYRY